MTISDHHEQTSRFNHRVSTLPETEHVSVEQFRLGMRRFAATVNIITVRADDVSFGLTVTSVYSLSPEPPRLRLREQERVDV